MNSMAEYFRKNRPQPVWQPGDRVFGRWNKIPFIGTVANDSLVSLSEGVLVSIFPDLPIKYQDKIHNVIKVRQTDIKFLKKID